MNSERNTVFVLLLLPESVLKEANIEYSMLGSSSIACKIAVDDETAVIVALLYSNHIIRTCSKEDYIRALG